MVNKNPNVIMVGGFSATGKSACLRNILDPTNVLYLNCENNKRLPFRSQFREFHVSTPDQVPQMIEQAEQFPEIHTIVVDTITHLMGMFEVLKFSEYEDGFAFWRAYSGYFRYLMGTSVANSTKNVIMLAHNSTRYNEDKLAIETYVKLKGELGAVGVESFFDTIVSTKSEPITKLAAYGSDMLNITPDDEALGYKYVFQTKKTKDTNCERMRAALDMWQIPETFIDNDIQHVIDRLHWYYAEPAPAVVAV